MERKVYVRFHRRCMRAAYGKRAMHFFQAAEADWSMEYKNENKRFL